MFKEMYLEDAPSVIFLPCEWNVGIGWIADASTFYTYLRVVRKRPSVLWADAHDGNIGGCRRGVAAFTRRPRGFRPGGLEPCQSPANGSRGKCRCFFLFFITCFVNSDPRFHRRSIRRCFSKGATSSLPSPYSIGEEFGGA